MASIFRTPDDQLVVRAKDTAEDRVAEDTAEEPIVIRKLDRLETTRQSNPSGS
jgi:hypothetical protein